MWPHKNHRVGNNDDCFIVVGYPGLTCSLWRNKRLHPLYDFDCFLESLYTKWAYCSIERHSICVLLFYSYENLNYFVLMLQSDSKHGPGHSRRLRPWPGHRAAGSPEIRRHRHQSPSQVQIYSSGDCHDTEATPYSRALKLLTGLNLWFEIWQNILFAISLRPIDVTIH